MRDTAVLRNRRGDGMGTARVEVIRQSDGESLGIIRYQPDSEASCRALEEDLLDIQERYQVKIVE